MKDTQNQLENKVVVITGSTRGFGYALAQEMLRAGAKVTISGRSQATMDQAVDSLKELGRVIGHPCDVSLPEQVYTLARSSAQEFGTIDFWINNAGYTTSAGRVIDFPPDEAMSTLKTNCLGAYNGTQAALFYMLPRKQGTLVNIYGRGSNLKSATPSGLYGATKAWITSFTRTLAAEHKGSGIHIVGYSPGMMLTDMLVVGEVVGAQVKEMMKNMPMVLKALANPPEVPAKELVKLLQDNQKEFVEYRLMRGRRAMSMISKLIWMQINPKARPAPVEYPLVEPFRPPIED